MNIYNEVGAHIRARRKRLGLTLEDLEERCHLSASFLGQVERSVKKASLQTLVKVAKALDVPVASLFDPPGKLPPALLSEKIETVLASSTKKEQALLLAALRLLAKGLKRLR